MPDLRINGTSLPTDRDAIRANGQNVDTLRVNGVVIWKRDFVPPPQPTTGTVNFVIDQSGLSGATAVASPSSSANVVGGGVSTTIIVTPISGRMFNSASDVSISGGTPVRNANGTITATVSTTVTSLATRNQGITVQGASIGAQGLATFSVSGSVSGASASFSPTAISSNIGDRVSSTLTISAGSGRSFPNADAVSRAISGGSIIGVSINAAMTVITITVQSFSLSASTTPVIVSIAGVTEVGITTLSWSASAGGLTGASFSFSPVSSSGLVDSQADTTLTVSPSSGNTFASVDSVTGTAGAKVDILSKIMSGSNIVFALRSTYASSDVTRSITLAGSSMTPPANNAPVISSLSPEAGATLRQSNTNFSIAANATDADGDDLSYSWTASGAGGRVVSGGTSRTALFTTTSDGSMTATCTVTDGRGGSASSSITIIIESVVSITANPRSRTFSGSSATSITVSPSPTNAVVQVSGFTWSNGSPIVFSQARSGSSVNVTIQPPSNVFGTVFGTITVRLFLNTTVSRNIQLTYLG